MLRQLRVFLCVGSICLFVGCNEEVEEISAKKSSDDTPEVSKSEKDELMQGENKREAGIAKAKEKQKKDTAKTKKTP